MDDREKYFDELIWKRPGLPDKVSPDEDIILVVREDIIIPILRAISYFALILILLIIRLFIQAYSELTFLALYDTLLGSLVGIMCISFILMYHNFYLSLQIVTNKRVIDIDQKGLFDREINSMPVSNIEDVTFKMSGFAGTVFNYGNVIIQTAGTGSTMTGTLGTEDVINGFTFNNVPHPKKVANLLGQVFHSNETDDRMEAAKLNAQAMHEMMKNNKDT
jgi:hypothetical protein